MLVKMESPSDGLIDNQSFEWMFSLADTRPRMGNSLPRQPIVLHIAIHPFGRRPFQGQSHCRNISRHSDSDLVATSKAPHITYLSVAKTSKPGMQSINAKSA